MVFAIFMLQHLTGGSCFFPVNTDSLYMHFYERISYQCSVLLIGIVCVVMCECMEGEGGRGAKEWYSERICRFPWSDYMIHSPSYV